MEMNEIGSENINNVYPLLPVNSENCDSNPAKLKLEKNEIPSIEISNKQHVNAINDEDSTTKRSFCKHLFRLPLYQEMKEDIKSHWEERNWRSPKVINLSIIILQAFFYLMCFAFPKIATTLQFTPSKRKEVWRYYTYSLIHAGCLHIFGNSVVQFLFGSVLELVHGNKIVWIFLIGVISGSLMQSFSSPQSSLQGASAGASALIAFRAVDVIMNFQSRKYPLPSLIVAVAFIIHTGILFKMPDSVSIWTHISGAIIGCLMGCMSQRDKHKYFAVCGVIFSIAYISILCIVNVLNITT